jgi:serine/threonine protein kinase
MHSKNDVFNTDWSVRPPPPIKPVDYSSSNGKSKQSRDVKTIPIITEPPATPAIKPSDGLEVRLLTHQELGHGRHATVHLALYREQHEARFLQAPQDSLSPPRDYHKVHDESSTWKICAAKRFAAGKDSQVAGLSEALMLSKLAKCSSVLKYIGLKDERPLSRPSSSRGNSSTEASDFDSNTQGSDGADPPSSRPSISRSHSNVSVSTPSSPVLKPSVHNSPIPGLMGLQQRQQEESKASLRRNATVKAPKAPSQLSHGRQPLAISTHNLNDDAPRMLLLTEYCALGNLAVFVLQHGPNVLGKRMFFKFAIDSMTALAAVHEKNIIHGDIKPQNCMVSHTTTPFGVSEC